MEEAKLNDIIDRLLEARNGRPGKQVHLVEAEIKQLCMTAREIFMAQPNLLELEAPIKICGGEGACLLYCSPAPRPGAAPLQIWAPATGTSLAQPEQPVSAA